MDGRRQNRLIVERFGDFRGFGFAALHAAQPGAETVDDAGIQRQQKNASYPAPSGGPP